MTLYSQQVCATPHWRMRKTAGPTARHSPDSFLSSYGPITLLRADARGAAMPLPLEPLVCCTRTVKKSATMWIPDAAKWLHFCLLQWQLFSM